jgi:hypothetical protein
MRDRQIGRHIGLTTIRARGHQITIPNDDPIRTGTLSVTLNSVAVHHGSKR